MYLHAAPLPEHLPLESVLLNGQNYSAYSSYSGSGTRYKWLWSAFDSGPLTADPATAEFQCQLLGGHLPSLHSQSQAEHLLGVLNALWPRHNGLWYQEGRARNVLWLGFFAHLSVGEYVGYVPWVNDGSGYNYSNITNTWSDYSAADWPGIGGWSPGSYEGRALTLAANNITMETFGMYRGDWRPYACACRYLCARHPMHTCTGLSMSHGIVLCNCASSVLCNCVLMTWDVCRSCLSALSGSVQALQSASPAG